MKKHTYIIYIYFSFLISIILLSGPMAVAQHDSTYYTFSERHVTGRFYFSRKFTSLIFQNRENNYSLRYRPNTTLNMGVGASYKWATLNLAYGFGFLNPERGRGKTRYLDLQFHGYGRKITVDVLGQFYKGFYLTPKGNASPSESSYYLRPDLRANIAGATIQYIFNHRRFSYRAAFLQSEWQKRSAGTFLIGAELYSGSVRADSTIVPTAIDEILAGTNLSKIRFVEFGPNLGYAYTYVYKERFFVTGSASLSLGLGLNTFYSDEGNKHTSGFSPNTLLKFSAGYNSNTWGVSFLYVSNALRFGSNDNDTKIVLRTGNFRLNLVYQFKPGKRVRKYMKVIDEVEEEVNETIDNK